MQGILYEDSLWVFLLVTVLIGGWAGWRTGRATAQTWRPLFTLLPYAAMLGVAVRFLHYALFEETLLSVHYILVDSLVALAGMALGWRLRRAQQMRTQYRWLYEAAGPFSWRAKDGGS